MDSMVFFFFKLKPAYEMRISDWSSDVCSSDLAMAYVLAGGRGSRLKELTDSRAKPAVYFGGKARIVDFALSNAINSGIRRIGVATQYKRSEERRVGKARVSTCRSRWSPEL